MTRLVAGFVLGAATVTGLLTLVVLAGPDEQADRADKRRVRHTKARWAP